MEGGKISSVSFLDKEVQETNDCRDRELEIESGLSPLIDYPIQSVQSYIYKQQQHIYNLYLYLIYISNIYLYIYNCNN